MPPQQRQTGSVPEYGTILSEFRQQVDLQKENPAVVYANESKSVTYVELQNQSRALAQVLKPNSGNNSIIATLLPGGYEHILSVLAVLETSKTYCSLSIDYPSVKLTLMLEELGNPLLITNKTILKSVGLNYENTYFLDAHEIQNLEYCESSYENPVEAEVAAVYFTSGSTGMPKAALLRSKVLVRFAKTGAAGYKVDSTDESVCVLNPGFVLNIYEVLIILLSGGTVHEVPSSLRYDVPKLREWVKNIGTITFMLMVSSTGEVFFKAEPEAFPSSFRTLVVAGEKLQSGPPANAPFKVYSAYGSTESTGISMTEVAPVSPLPNPFTQTLAGIPFPGITIYILNEDTLESLPIGETGEISVDSPCVFDGYLNRPEATASKFHTLENGVRVCRTGDLGYLQPDGNLVVLNRRDNQFKVSGYRFDLSDLEAALLQHSSVEKAVAVLEKSDTLKFHLFYKLKTQFATDSSQADLKIQEFLQDRLPHYAFPHSITEVDDFPRNGHGKIDKHALLLKRNADLDRKIVEPVVTRTEKTLVAIWSELLKIPSQQISRTDNFFSLGGSSNTAAAVISKLKQIDPNFQVEPFNIFRIPVLANLAEFLDKSPIGRLEDTRDFDAEMDSISLDFVKPRKLEKLLISAENILITGTTGYLGGALLLKLLETTTAKIYCLIRAIDDEEARGRLENAFQNLKRTIDTKYYPRLRFVPGNISTLNFGLSVEQYNDMAEAVDQVYHCAAEVHWLKRYDELRASNILGTLEILKFASAKKLKFLHYISTIGVLGLSNENASPHLESRKMAPNVQYEMGYIQSKWVAEKLVWKAIDAVVPGIVYRPGIIGSDSELGIFNSNDFITLLFQACKTLGAYPEMPWEFAYATLDFTANSIILISQNPEANSSKVFHVFQNGLSLEDFYEHFDKRGMKKMPISDWKDLILAAENKSSGSGALEMTKLFLSIPYFKDLTFFQLPFSKLKMNISNTETMKAVSSSKLELLSKEEQITNFVNSVLREES